MYQLPRLSTISAERFYTLVEGDARFNLFQERSPASAAALLRQITVHPPILLDSELPIVVWGHHYGAGRTIAGALELPAVPAMMLPAKTPSAALLLTALDAEGRPGQYRWDEIDRIVGLCESEGVPVPQTVLDALDPERDITGQLARYRALPAVVRPALDEKMIDIRTAELLPESLLPLWETVCEALGPLSFSDRRQGIRMIGEVLRRGDISAQQLPELLNSEAPAVVLETLERLRYPAAELLDTALADFRTAFVKGTGIEVAFPPRYEGDYLQFTFRARSARELHRKIGGLQRMEETVDELVALLF